MKIRHALTLDLQQRNALPMLHLKQGDTLTRELLISLSNNGSAWTPPEEAVIYQMVYCKADRTGGCYDTLPDGSPACAVEEGRILAQLHPQMLTVPGFVICELRMLNEQGAQLSTFSFFLSVEASADARVDSEDYYRFFSLEQLRNAIGDATALKTADKSSLVAAVNELVQLKQPDDTLRYSAQSLNAEQRAQARENIAAAPAVHIHKYSDLSGIPTLPESLPANGGNADTLGGKTAEELQQTILLATSKLTNTILTEAKESGAFDGKTPVKGEDYFTEADKAEMVEAVSEAMKDIPADIAWLYGYGIPILTLTGDTTGMTKENAVTLSYACKDATGTERTGSCTLKWQGASSLAYDKKNFTIKFGSAIDVGWGAQKKYCLKANFIDHSHARNVVSAKLWGTLVASRSHVNGTMAAAPNYGAVDGFPCAIVLNGTFQGLYTWNIPKDAWMANMGNGAKEAILCASNGTDATAFKALPTYVEDDDLEIEYATDEDDVAWVKESANRLISLIMNSTGYDMDTEIAKYLDWESAIDYYLFTAFHAGKDNVTKNYLLLTYDGVKWYFGAYDMDGTYGIKWDGKEFDRANSDTTMTLDRLATSHRAFELIKRFKTDALRARWAELRKNYLSEGKIDRTFENFVKGIPSRLYFEDVCRWPSVPSSSVSNIDQILRWVHLRLEYMDEMIAKLPEQETPVEPEPEAVNQIPLSTDTDGSIYNGIGYKDDTRLSSSGTVSGTPQTGSVTTGFIPVKVGDVVRIKGGIFLNAPSGHYYFCLYNSEKTKMECVNAGNVAGYPQFAFSYDEASGITTVTLGDGGNGWEQNIAFFRTNVYGKGADLMVTVNQEIA